MYRSMYSPDKVKLVNRYYVSVIDSENLLSGHGIDPPIADFKYYNDAVVMALVYVDEICEKYKDGYTVNVEDNLSRQIYFAGKYIIIRILKDDVPIKSLAITIVEIKVPEKC